MLQPRKLKHSKQHKARKKGISRKGIELAFASYGLKAMEAKWISAQQIEAGRLAIVRTLKKKGKLWIRIFPYKPVTSKGLEAPMGGGKGKPNHYIFLITPGRIIFEVDGVNEEKAKEVLRKAGAKMPIRTKFVKR